MSQAVGWICSLVGFACSSVPNVAVIQTAYEREAAAGSQLHDKDLQVLAAKCHDNSDNHHCNSAVNSHSLYSEYSRFLYESGCRQRRFNMLCQST